MVGIKIKTDWCGQALPNPASISVDFSYQLQNEQHYLVMDVVSPFYNDPPAPNCPAGQSCQNLWNYEGLQSKTIKLGCV